MNVNAFPHQVVVQTKYPIDVDSNAAVLEVVADGTREKSGGANEGAWRQSGGWLLSQLTEAQRKQGSSFVNPTLECLGALKGLTRTPEGTLHDSRANDESSQPLLSVLSVGTTDKTVCDP